MLKLGAFIPPESPFLSIFQHIPWLKGQVGILMVKWKVWKDINMYRIQMKEKEANQYMKF